MKILTHYFLSECVKENVENQLGTDLNLHFLKLATIYADRSHLTVRRPHYYSKSFGYVQRMIERLCEYELDADMPVDSGFSFRLGIVLHYLSDFFCAAHIGDSMGGAKEHMQYEIDLMNYMDENGERCREFIRSCKIAPAAGCREILDFIKERHSEYAAGELSCGADFEAAARVLCYTSASVVSVCMKATARRRLLLRPLTAVFTD